MDFVLAVAITEAKDAANLKSLNLTNLDLSQVNKAIDLNAIAAKKSAQERFQKDFSSLSSVIAVPTSLVVSLAHGIKVTASLGYTAV